MYVKINPPKDLNKCTCAKLVDYLEKENEKLDVNERQMFFNQDREAIPNQEVIHKIDSNKACLGRKDDKYYMISINPSQKELKHICKEISGRDIKDISQLTKQETKAFELKLKEYSRRVMDEYAKNFNKGLTGNDIMYYGKVEHIRTYKRNSKELLEARLNQAGLGKKDFELPKIGDKKEGLQSHIHIVVSRKDISNTVKLSPFVNARKAMNKLPDGTETPVGFDRKQFSQNAEKAFDAKFEFKRDFNKSFRYYDMMKNQAGSITKSISYQVVPEEMRTIGRTTEEAIRIISKLNRPSENTIIANSIKAKIPTLNFLSSSSEMLKAQGRIIKDKFPDLGTIGNSIPKSFFSENYDLNELVNFRKTTIQPINKEISETYKLGLAKQKEDEKLAKATNSIKGEKEYYINDYFIKVKELREKKAEIVKPFDTRIKEILDQKISILDDNKLGSLNPNSIIHINKGTIDRVINVSTNMDKISAKLTEIHNATDFLKNTSILSSTELSQSINNLKSKQLDIFGTVKSIDNQLNELHTAKNEIWGSIRSHRLFMEAQYDYITPLHEGKYLSKEERILNAEDKALKVAELKANHEEMKKAMTPKIEQINAAITDLKASKENILETSKVLTNTNRAKDPLDLIRTTFQHVPVARECLQAINYVYNPTKLAIDIGKKIISVGLSTGL